MGYDVLLGAAILGIFAASEAFGQDATSSVVVPVSLNLAAAQERLNAEVPEVLYAIDEKITCVPAKWAKIGPIKTKISPDIHCQVTGSAVRTGPIVVTGSGSQLIASVSVKATITGRGTGDIGKNIRETAEAAATLSIAATPTIDDNWNVGLEVDHNVHWDQRPGIVLFGLFPITFTSLVDPKVQDAINAQKAKLPEMLAGLNIRSKVEKAWAEVQKPFKISEQPATWFTFKPNAIGFSGLNTENNILRASAVLKGDTAVHLGTPPQIEPSPLPSLSSDFPRDGLFRVNIPIRVPLDVATQLANEEVDKLGEIPVGGLHYLTMSDVQITEDKGALNIRLKAVLDNKEGWIDWFDIFHWFDVSGNIYLKARPIVDDEKRVLSLTELDFDTDTSSLPVDSLVEVFRLAPIRSILEKLVTYDYGAEAAKAQEAANAQFSRDLGEGFRLDGKLDQIAVQQPVVGENAIVVPFGLGGTMQVSFGLN